MAKTKDTEVEELEDIEPNDEAEVEETEDEEDDTPSGIRPSDLAEELDISAKALRGWLRKEYPRGAEAKNTNWFLNEDQVEAATKRFTKSDEDEVEEEVEDDDEA